MGKIKRVAAAGFYIPLAPPVGTENLFAQLQDILRQLHPNSRILLMANSLSFVTYSPQNPPVLLPLKTVCLAWDNPLSSISGRKRYNTLYFVPKSVCQPFPLDSLKRAKCPVGATGHSALWCTVCPICPVFSGDTPLLFLPYIPYITVHLPTAEG